MKHLLKREGGFTLIELLVVILIIGILIAVSAPSFLGQTKKAHESAARQNMAVAYRAAKAYAVNGPDGQNTFSGFDQAALLASEPGSPVIVNSATDTTLSLSDTEPAGGGCTYSQTFSNTTGPGAFTAGSGC